MMQITLDEWMRFTDRLSKLSKDAADKMLDYIKKGGGYANMDAKEVIAYATALARKYGEGAATLAALMYEAVAELSGIVLPAADVVAPPDYNDMAKMIRGAAKISQSDDFISSVVGRAVKRTGADTTLNNAIRDGADFAWIPRGDTCPFCIALAANGWQKATAAALKDGHAEHIHNNCDCMYAVRFKADTSYKGYDPGRYKKMYDAAEGRTSKEKINSLRRMYYDEHKGEINEQKREAYAERTQT